MNEDEARIRACVREWDLGIISTMLKRRFTDEETEGILEVINKIIDFEMLPFEEMAARLIEAVEKGYEPDEEDDEDDEVL